MQARVPIRNEWLGEKVFIIGGGPSLKNIDINLIQGKGRVIALNNAYKIAPWADWLLFADAEWYKWHKDALVDIKMPVITSAVNEPLEHDMKYHDFIVRWPKKGNWGLVEDPGGYLVGDNAGQVAMSLAEYLGAKTIVLLGFDLNADIPENQPLQWHNEHKRRSNTSMYTNSFIPNFIRTAPYYQKRGVYVCNVNPTSAIPCFPFVKFEDTIA